MPLNAMRFAAKRIAFWCKTQGKMVQNAVQNGAKRSVKCCKIQVEKHKNTLQLHKQNLLELLNRRLKRAKKPLKSKVLGSKSVQLGMKNFKPTTKLER